MAQDLQQLDRNHAVSFSTFLFAVLISEKFSSGWCSPRDSGRLFTIGSNLSCCLFLSYAFLISGDFASSGCAQVHPLGVVPEIRADCLQSVRIFHVVYFFHMPSSYRETLLPVGARKRTHLV